MKVARLNGNLSDRFPETYGLLDRFLNEGVATKRDLRQFRPQVDAIETEKAFELQVALAGFKKEDIKLDFEDGKLTISGERKFDAENKERTYHFLETNYGRFSRTFNLPENIREAAIEASFENGLLTVVLPKDEQKVLKRHIQVK